jgi:hypothetical protein
VCSEYDIVNEITELERQLPFRLKWEHIKGHQDEKKKWYELTWMERLNVRANILATEGLTVAGSPSTIVSFIPSSKVGLRINYTDVTSKYATHLRKPLLDQPLCALSRTTTAGMKTSSTISTGKHTMGRSKS